MQRAKQRNDDQSTQPSLIALLFLIIISGNDFFQFLSWIQHCKSLSSSLFHSSLLFLRLLLLFLRMDNKSINMNISSFFCVNTEARQSILPCLSTPSSPFRFLFYFLVSFSISFIIPIPSLSVMFLIVQFPFFCIFIQHPAVLSASLLLLLF